MKPITNGGSTTSSTKKVNISQDVRFDEGYAYDFELNKYIKEVREFWSPEGKKKDRTCDFERNKKKVWELW